MKNVSISIEYEKSFLNEYECKLFHGIIDKSGEKLHSQKL